MKRGQPSGIEWWIRLSMAGDMLAVVGAGSALGLVSQGTAPPFLASVALGGGLIAVVKFCIKVRGMARLVRERRSV